MSPYEICAFGETAPTIDSIVVAEFESNADLKAWLGKHGRSSFADAERRLLRIPMT